MLKNNDVDFNKKIRVLDNNYGTYYKDSKNNTSNINKYNINNEIIQNINIKCLTVEELWEFKKNLLFEFCDLYKTIPLENIIYKNQKIGFWYKSQKIKIKNNLFNNTINLSKRSGDKELFSGIILEQNIFIYNEFIQNIYVKDDLFKNKIKLLECNIDVEEKKELFGEVNTIKNTNILTDINTMNLSENSIDKELLSEVLMNENTINLLKHSGDKENTTSSYYKCLNCNYNCKTFNDMIKHLNRKTVCNKFLESYNYTNEEIIKLSLIPYINNTNYIDINKIRDIFKNIRNKISKKNFFEQFIIIEKNKLRSCPLCNKNYKLKHELKKHLILECVSIEN